MVHRALKDVLRETPEKWDGAVPVGASGATAAKGATGVPARQTSAPADVSDDASGLASRMRARRPLDSRRDAGATPWSKRRDHEAHKKSVEAVGGAISLEELHNIAVESSQAE